MTLNLEKDASHEEKREAILQECIKAHDEYLLTAQHVTGEEVDAWVDLLLEGKQAKMPKV